MQFFLWPYQAIEWSIAPLLWLLSSFLLLCLVAALRRQRGADAALVGGALVFLLARWWATLESGLAAPLAILGGVLVVIGILAAPASPPAPRLPFWVGVAVALAALVLKSIALDTWPAHLNAYSAETGLRGLQALDGSWPRQFFSSKEYDLVNGGVSPLQLPLTWLSMKGLGGTITALRFAEVAASTALLLIFWAWLRVRLPGMSGLLALTLFATAPWHLAQSRMGTFFSVSVTWALLLLLLAERVARGRAALWQWALFGACAGGIGYCYAPINVLYLFFPLVLLAGAGASGGMRGAAVATVCFAAVIAVQVGVPPRFDHVLHREFGALATDTSILRKTADGRVADELQPLGVIAGNGLANAATWWRRTWDEPAISSWYAVSLTIALPLAIAALASRRLRVAALFFLIGTLPPLLVYPVHRRSLIVWPFVYAIGAVVLGKLVAACGRSFDSPVWRGATGGLAFAAVLAAVLHGFFVYATTNSTVRTGTYFGPDHRLEMLLEAERLLPLCVVVFVNPTFEEEVVARMRLYEPARRSGGRFDFAIAGADGVDPPPEEGDATCFLQLEVPDESKHGIREVMRRYPGGIHFLRNSPTDQLPMYTVYQLPAGSV